MTKALKKPEKKTKLYYDYNKCCDYLQKKYKYDERDYSKDHNDFWYWLIHHFDVHDGCFIVFTREEVNDSNFDAGDWVKEIYNRYLDEFADEDGKLEMYVWW